MGGAFVKVLQFCIVVLQVVDLLLQKTITCLQLQLLCAENTHPSL